MAVQVFGANHIAIEVDDAKKAATCPRTRKGISL